MRFGIVLVTVVFSGFQICHGMWPRRNRSPRPPNGENEIDYGASGGGGHIPSNVYTEHILGNSDEENEIERGHGSSPHSEGHHHHQHHHHHHHHPHHHHHHHHRSHSPDSSDHNCFGGPGDDFGHYEDKKCPCKKGKHKKTKEEKEKEKQEKKKQKLIKKTLKSGVKTNPNKFNNYCQ